MALPYRRLVGLALVCLICSVAAWAQVTTAEIVGTVTDGTGAVVPNCSVTVKNLGTGLVRTVSTNASGDYTFALLPVGAYSVTAELQGFKTFTASNVALAVGDRARVDAVMQVGEMSQRIEVVESTAGALQTDSSSVGALVTSKAVQDLPVNGRNFMTLVQLSTGVSEGALSSLSGGTRPDDRRQTSAVSANGQNDAQNNFLIDGMDNNERNIGTVIVKPSIDALAEVKVQTNMYSADIGRTGGAVVNMLTKSGTNEFHGTVFEFLRNDLLDAKNFFNVQTAGNPWAGQKPEYRQNQFGGSFGGPIRKDKTFFFGDYEGLRVIQGILGQALVPTPCQLGRATCNGITQLGNFSDLPAGSVIYDITQSKPAPFANNIVPLSRMNSIVKNYAALYPQIGSATCGLACNFANSPLRTQTADTFDTRIDHNFSETNTLFGRYSYNNTNSYIPGLFPEANVAGVSVLPGGNSGAVGLGVDNFPGTAHQRAQNLGLTHSHVFRPTLLLQLRAGVTRYVNDSQGLNNGTDVNMAFGGPAGVNISPQSSGLALISFANGGYGGVGDAQFMPTQYWTTTYQLNGDLSWTKGAHNLKFGGNLIRRLWNQYQSSTARGNFTFGSQQTNSTAGGAGGSGGNSFASFLLSYPNSAARSYSLLAPQYRAWDVGGYVQDDWRATRRLTLNLGLRYDIYTRFSEKHNHISSFDPAVPSTLAGGQVLVAGQNGVSQTVNVPTEYTNFQPRLGLAWTVGTGFVLRGGFGISFTPSGMGSPANMKSFPFVSNIAINNPMGVAGAAPPFLFGDALPPLSAVSTCLVAACGATTRGIAVPSSTGVDFRNSVSYQYNITAEKEFAGNVITASYVAVLGRKLNWALNEDQPLPPLGPGGCGVTTTISLPNPCQPYYQQLPLVSSVAVLRSNGSSDYQSLQTAFQRRYKNGLTLSANYTWAHSLSNSRGPEGTFVGQGVVPQWATWYDWGNSFFDVRHRIAVTVNYELPFGKSLRGVVGQIVKNWQVNAITLYSTGYPFTVTNTGNPQQNTGTINNNGDRPNLLQPNSGFTRTIDQWFDTSAFYLQPWGTAGNEGANPYYGPDMKRLDFSVFKTFPITERVKLQFRAESFNLTNSPSFSPPTSTIAGWTSSDPATARPTLAGNFGKITRTSPFYTPRDIQFALKLMF